MGHAHTAHAEIRNPGSLTTSSGLKAGFMLLTVVGFAIFALSVKSGGDTAARAWVSFVHNHFFFMSLAIGGMFFAAIQWLTGAMWSAPVRRIGESFTAYLPIVFVTFGIVFIGLHQLYHWSHADVVAHDTVLAAKSGYLNSKFFLIRNIVAIGLWVVLARSMIGNSLAQDQTKDYRLTQKNKMLAPAFLLVFGITFTMAAFDQLMSLDPHWFSTMFGVYVFAGMFYSTLALICLMTLFLKRKGLLLGIVNENHLHDIGKFMFAFTVFWAYIGFSQYLLIWYANMPEETGYYLNRMQGGWAKVSTFLLFGKFGIPFFVLMKREAKRCEKTLMVMGLFMLFAQWVDLMWIIQPEFFKNGPSIGMVEIGTFLGFLGLFGLAVFRFLGRHNVVAIGDPRLQESVHHHHQ